MNAISDFLNTNSPKLQSAEEAILTICDRLSNATLISDRRAAVLSLKAFSRQYRESVVAHGLRGLITTFTSSADDLEISKSLLKTFLILFVKTDTAVDNDDDLLFAIDFRDRNLRIAQDDEGSVSSIDQISLFVSDELLATESVFEILINLLSKTDDFYLKLYVLQIIELLVSTRPIRAKETLLSSPLSLPVIISALEEVHEPIRNEAILLLTRLSIDNFNIQKLVAFENIFDKLFDIINAEGLVRGSLVVADCLDFFMELLKYNASNQKLFLETQCIPKLAKLINQPLTDVDFFWNDQRIENLTRCVRLAKIFVVEGNNKSQAILADNHLMLLLLQLLFTISTPNQIKKEALLTIGDIIRGNPDLQLRFSQIDVPYVDPSAPNRKPSETGIPVISALLNWVLYCNSIHTFDIRVAAELVMEAYFENNKDAQIAFIEDQISEYKKDSGEKEMNGSQELGLPHGNIFNTLLEYDPDCKLNPYKSWFSCVLLINLFEDNEIIKEKLRVLKIGEESAGEEVLTSVQAIQEQLMSSLEFSDPRMSIGYLMLLISWLFLDRHSCSDFLKEYANIISLISHIAQLKSSVDFAVVDCMLVILLGVVYDSTTSESTIPRADLHALLTKMIGEENYFLKIKMFKESKLLANVEEDSLFNYKKDSTTGLPEVYLNYKFKEFFIEIAPRIKKLKSPAIEPTGVISYEVLDELESNNLQIKKELEESNEIIKVNIEKLKQLDEQNAELLASLENSQKDLELSGGAERALKEELSTVQNELSLLKDAHTQLESTSSKYYEDLQATSKDVSSFELRNTDLQTQLNLLKELKQKAEDGINKMSRELFQLTREKDTVEKKVKNLENELNNTTKKHQKIVSDFEKQLNIKEAKISLLETKNAELVKEIGDLKQKQSSMFSEIGELKSRLTDLEATNSQYLDKFRLSSKVIDEFKTENSELNKKLEAITIKTNNEIYSLKSNLDSFKAQVAELTKTNQDLQQKLAAIGEEKTVTVKELQGKHQDSEKKNSELSENLSKLKTELKSVISSKLSLEELHRSLNSTHSELKSTHEKLIKSHEEKLQDLNEELNKKLDTKCSELTTSLKNKEKLENELKEMKTKFESELDQNSKRLADLMSSENALKSKIETLSKQLEEEKSRYDTTSKDWEKTKTDLSKSIDDLTKKNELLDSEVSQLKEAELASSKKLQDAKSDHKTLLGSLEDEAHKLKEKLEGLEKSSSKEKLDLSESISNLTDDKTILKAQFEKLKQSKEEELSKLQSDLESVTNEKNKSATELAAKIKELEELQLKFENELSGLNETIESLTAENDNIKNEFESFKESSTSLETLQKKNFADLKEQKESILQEKNSLSSTLELISQKMNESDQKLTESTKENQKLSKDLDASKQELSKQLKSHETQEKKLTTKISKLEAEIVAVKEDLAKKVKEVETERTNLTKDSETVMQSYVEKISALETEKLKSKDEIEMLKSQIDDLELKASSDSGSLKEQQDEIEKLNGELSTLESKIEDKSKLLNDVSNKLKEVEGKLEKSQQEVSKISFDLERKEKELSKLSSDRDSDLKKLKDELSTTKKKSTEDSTSHSKLISGFEKKVEELTKLLKSEKDYHTTKTEETEKLRQQVDSLNQKFDSIVNEKSTLTTQLSELKMVKDKYSELQTKHEKLELEKEKLSETLQETQDKLKSTSSSSKEIQDKKELFELQVKEKEENATRLSKELNDLKQTHEKLVSEHGDLKKDMASISEKQKETEASLSKELESAKVDALRKTEKDKNEIESIKEELEKTKLENSELKVKTQETTEKIESLSKKLNDSTKQEDLEKKILSLEKKISSMVPKSDLDDMFFLMKETTKDYKNRLRNLGETLSSDDDDDDDDDDDEDEDEDEDE